MNLSTLMEKLIQLSQDNRVAKVTMPTVSDTLLLYRMNGSESLSHLFEYELELLSDSQAIDMQSLLGNSISVALTVPDESLFQMLADGHMRYFNGIVTHASQLGMLGDLYVYRVIMHPVPWLLTLRSNCRVFQQQSVPEIVKSILGEHDFSAVLEKFSGNFSYQPREFCVQYRETDFNFISRLLEQEGIYYFFQHDANSHTLILCDDIVSHVAFSVHDQISFYPPPQPGGVAEHIWEWRLNQQIRPAVFALNDYDFSNSRTDLTGVAHLGPLTDNLGSWSQQAPVPSASGTQPHIGNEFYDYPGYPEANSALLSANGYSLANQYAKVRLEGLANNFERIQAKGNVRALSAGTTFRLADFPRPDQNRQYLAVSTRLGIQNNAYLSQMNLPTVAEEYQCEYELTSTEYAFKPQRRSRMPLVHGLQSAWVVGTPGEEITTDPYGRIKVQFQWDRYGNKDQNSSCWVRVAQIWAGKGFGAVFTPRIGQEVIVDFLQGNPDKPIIIGSLYNDQQTPPISLPDNKTQSGVTSRSSPGGGSENYNQILFEDAAGWEQLNIRAEKDLYVYAKKGCYFLDLAGGMSVLGAIEDLIGTGKGNPNSNATAGQSALFATEEAGISAALLASLAGIFKLAGQDQWAKKVLSGLAFAEVLAIYGLMNAGVKALGGLMHEQRNTAVEQHIGCALDDLLQGSMINYLPNGYKINVVGSGEITLMPLGGQTTMMFNRSVTLFGPAKSNFIPTTGLTSFMLPGDDVLNIKFGDQVTTLSNGDRKTKLGAGNDILELEGLGEGGNVIINLEKGDHNLNITAGNHNVKIMAGSQLVTLYEGNQSLSLLKGHYRANLMNGSYNVMSSQSINFAVGGSTLTISSEGITLQSGISSLLVSPSGVTVKGVTVATVADAVNEVIGAVVQVNPAGPPPPGPEQAATMVAAAAASQTMSAAEATATEAAVEVKKNAAMLLAEKNALL